MKLRDYFSKDFCTSDRQEIDTLRTHYYRARVDVVKEKVIEVLKKDKALINGVDNERGEIVFESAEYSGVASITAVSFTEIAVDFNILTYNILPTAKGKKIIEKFYRELDSCLELKGIALYK